MELTKENALQCRYELEETCLSLLRQTQKRVWDVLNNAWDNWVWDKQDLYKEFQEIESLLNIKINHLLNK